MDLNKINDILKEIRLKRNRSKRELKKAEKKLSKKIDSYGWNVSAIQMYNNINVFCSGEQKEIENIKKDLDFYENRIDELIKLKENKK